MAAEVPLPLFQCCVEEQGGVLSAHSWNLHVLPEKPHQKVMLILIYKGKEI